MTSIKQLIAVLLIARAIQGQNQPCLNFKAHDPAKESESRYAESWVISINTNRRVAPIPVPFSGAVTGESRTLAIDLGIATKEISVSVLSQVIDF